MHIYLEKGGNFTFQEMCNFPGSHNRGEIYAFLHNCRALLILWKTGNNQDTLVPDSQELLHRIYITG